MTTPDLVAKPKHHSYFIPSLFSLHGLTKGEVGIEIETIGKNLPFELTSTKLWVPKEDQSIKCRPSENGLEYVLAQPIGRQKIGLALDELWKEFERVKATIAEGRISNSVHVHINAQTLTMQQVYTWLALYFLFEEVLVRWAGEDRIGNLFCLRARDAEGLIQMLRSTAKADAFGSFGTDNYRYAAANVRALSKFGSLEFRALRGTCKKEVIVPWIETLLAIKDKSLEYKNPIAVLNDFNVRGHVGMVLQTIPAPLKQYAVHQPDLSDVMYEGMRLVQDFAYACEWQDKPYTGGDKPKPKKTVSFSDIVPDYMDQVAVSDTNTVQWTTLDPVPPPNFTPPPPQPPPGPTFNAIYTQSMIGCPRNWRVVPFVGKFRRVSPSDSINAKKIVKLSDQLCNQLITNNWSIAFKSIGGTQILSIIDNQSNTVGFVSEGNVAYI